ncbi:hypothetical protein, partial [Lacticaseibacillus sharpeae]|uniref:hypothetical protein n=1 Tax=Lacticaseibacillus sharpeae TaxID=1626 RepID=UPI001CDA7A31
MNQPYSLADHSFSFPLTSYNNIRLENMPTPSNLGVTRALMPITFSNLSSAHKVQGIFHLALVPAKLTVVYDPS